MTGRALLVFCCIGVPLALILLPNKQGLRPGWLPSSPGCHMRWNWMPARLSTVEPTVEKIQHTVEGALDTYRSLEDSFSELEGKTAELYRHLHDQNVEKGLLFEMFRIFSQIRFQLVEAGEYQALLSRHLRQPRGLNGRAEAAPRPTPKRANGRGKNLGRVARAGKKAGTALVPLPFTP